MERRLILAFMVSMAVIIGWNAFFAPPAPKNTPAKIEKAAPAKEAKAPLPDENAQKPAGAMLPEKGKEIPAPTPAADASKDNAVPTPAPAAPKAPEVLKVIETPLFKATFTSYGARLKSFVLKAEKYAVPTGSGATQAIDLVSSKDGSLPYTLLLDNANFRYDPDAPFEIDGADAKSIVFSQSTPQGVIVRKRFALRSDYLFDLDVSVENNAAQPISFFPKLRLNSSQNDEQVKKVLFSSTQENVQFPKAYIDGAVWEEMSRDKLAEEQVAKGAITWAGIDDRYFLLSVLPLGAARSQIATQNHAKAYINAKGEPHHSYTTVLNHSLEKQELAPGAKKTLNYRLFIGPKEYDLLKRIGFNLSDSVDFWVLGFLAIPMLYVLKYSYWLIPNWGVAIILLTILVKLITIPLTHKSQVSMQRMSALKPKVDALKEKHKDDKQVFNQKVMELYKSEGVNPLGGCLPILLQMPIYFALYRMLQNAVELFNSTFIPGWLNDLVQPDPYFILPVLMAALMWLQQHITPAMDAQQAKMMKWMMPAMMLVFMIVLPAGLVLYIVVNSLLSVIQQWWMNKRQKEKTAMGPAPKPAKA